MAIKNIEIRPDGNYDDVLHPQTNSGMVIHGTRSLNSYLDENDVYVEGIYDQLQEKLGMNDNAVSASKLHTARTINGMQFDGSANIVNYGVSNNIASSTTKNVALSGFSLVTGARVSVKFNYINLQDEPTLNVNNTGEKPLKKADGTPFKEWAKGGVYTFIYDGSAFILQGESGVNIKGLVVDRFVTRPITNSQTADLIIAKSTSTELTTLHGNHSLKYFQSLNTYDKNTGQNLTTTSVTIGSMRASVVFGDTVIYSYTDSNQNEIRKLDIATKTDSRFIAFSNSDKNIEYAVDGNGHVYALATNGSGLTVHKLDLSTATLVSSLNILIGSSSLLQSGAKIQCKGDYIYVTYSHPNSTTNRLGVVLIDIDEMRILVNDVISSVTGSSFGFVLSDKELGSMYIYGTGATPLAKVNVGNTTGSWTSSLVSTYVQTGTAFLQGLNLGDDVLLFSNLTTMFVFDAKQSKFTTLHSTGTMMSYSPIIISKHDKEIIVAHNAFPYGTAGFSNGAGFMFHTIYN